MLEELVSKAQADIIKSVLATIDRATIAQSIR